jgi:hypothetical protein
MFCDWSIKHFVVGINLMQEPLGQKGTDTFLGIFLPDFVPLNQTG